MSVIGLAVVVLVLAANPAVCFAPTCVGIVRRLRHRVRERMELSQRSRC